GSRCSTLCRLPAWEAPWTPFVVAHHIDAPRGSERVTFVRTPTILPGHRAARGRPARLVCCSHGSRVSARHRLAEAKVQRPRVVHTCQRLAAPRARKGLIDRTSDHAFYQAICRGS